MSDIKITTDGISSKVGTVENTVSTLNNNLYNLSTRMSNAEQKITDSAIVNTVQGAITNAKNEAINAAGAHMELTAQQLKVDFTNSGAYNLLKNSGFKNGYAHWWIHTHANPVGDHSFIGHTNDWGFPDSSVKTFQLRYSYQSGKEMGLAQNIDTAIGQTYTISFYYAAHRLDHAGIIVRNPDGGWLTSHHFNPSVYQGGRGNVANWGKVSLSFTATATVHAINIVACNGQNDGYFWVAKPQIVQGRLDMPYAPHIGEVYDGATIIDSNGVTIENGALTVKNKAGSTVLSGDHNGNLVLDGCVKTQRGEQYVAMTSGGIDFKDAHRNEQLMRAGIACFNANRDQNGVNFALAQCGDYIRFSHISKLDLTDG